MRLLSRASIPLFGLLASTSAGCGYTEQQWQVQVDKYEHERTRRDAAEDRATKADAELEDVRGRTAALEERLVSAGIDPERLAAGGGTASLEERERALADMKARAAKVEGARARVESLRQKVAALAIPGSTVIVRKNRITIVVPSDALFDGGKDAIKKSGRDALKKLADGIKGEAGLASRDYQVAAHTDSKKPSGGAFSDNLGLTTMRARAVVLFLTDPASGALPREKWSAAGYADVDPLGSNETDDGRASNRRVEITVVPSADELVDLRSIAPAPATPPVAPPATQAAPAAAAPAAPPPPGTKKVADPGGAPAKPKEGAPPADSKKAPKKAPPAAAPGDGKKASPKPPAPTPKDPAPKKNPAPKKPPKAP